MIGSGTLSLVALSPCDLFAGWLAPVAVGICVAIGCIRFSGVAFRQRFHAYAESSEATEYSIVQSSRHQRRSIAFCSAGVCCACPRPEACLLLRAKLDWPHRLQLCDEADPSCLSHGVVGETHWSLLDWQPSADSGWLSLQVGHDRTARFRLALDPVAPAVIGISAPQRLAPSTHGEIDR